MANAIFQVSVGESRAQLSRIFSGHVFSLNSIAMLCTKNYCTISDYLAALEHNQSEYIDKLVTNKPAHKSLQETLDDATYNPLDVVLVEYPVLWTPKKYTEWTNYTFKSTIWLRIHVADALSKYHHNYVGITEYLNAHVPLIRYIDSMDDPSDENLSTAKLTMSIGPSRYERHKHFIEKHTRKLPNDLHTLNYIERTYPAYCWRIEKVLKLNINVETLENPLDKPAENHSIYFACLYIMNNCKRVYDDTKDDALYFYYVCFLDLFYFGACCKKMDDDTLQTAVNELTPLQQYYPHWNRAFTAYDLPDVFHVFIGIPLSGEKRTPGTNIAKLLQKCLPFASQRRNIIKFIRKLTTTQQAFKSVMNKVYWCMMANMYPDTEKEFNLTKLIALQHSAKFIGDANTMIISIRMWVQLSCKNNTIYINEASKHIDWQMFLNSTLNNEPVYRYRKTSRTLNILTTCTDILKNDVYREQDAWTTNTNSLNDIFYIPESVSKLRTVLRYSKKVYEELQYTIDPTIKQNILNLLIKVGVEERFSPIVLNTLRVERYGGLSVVAVNVIYNLLKIYSDSAKPQTYKKQLDLLSVSDFKLITWYFSVVWTLERIQFVPLDQGTVDQIDDAMRNKRYFLYKDQPLNQSVYDVCISICCNNLLTKTGDFEFGHSDVVYDIESGRMLCAKTQNNSQSVEHGVGFKEVELRKNTHKQKRLFTVIPCADNPVLQIPLKGYMLIYQITAETKERYMHCPQCGSFHKYIYKNWSSSYKCEPCRKIATEKIYATCCMCDDRIPQKLLHKTTLVVLESEPEIDGDYFQHVYFCAKHYRHARKLNRNNTKKMVFKHTTAKITQQNKNRARVRY